MNLSPSSFPSLHALPLKSITSLMAQSTAAPFAAAYAYKDTCISMCISAYRQSARLRAPLLGGVHENKHQGKTTEACSAAPSRRDGPWRRMGPSRAVAVLTGPASTFSRWTNQDIQWLPTTSCIKCREPTCACNASRKEEPSSCPALEGQVHLSGDTQYVRALGKIFEAGGQKQGNKKPGTEGQSGQVLPPYVCAYKFLFKFVYLP